VKKIQTQVTASNFAMSRAKSNNARQTNVWWWHKLN